MQEVIELYLDDIIPNRFQPREKFDEEALNELSNSIKEHGVIQPIIVRKIGEKYEIIAGERRYKASALAGLTKIPAIIRNLDDKEASKVALLENLQRKDLTAIEEARTYQKILELDSMTQEELGKTMGKSQAAIANKIRLLSLTDEVQEALLNDQISERHARSLLNIPNGNEQIEMLNRVIRNRMSVRELDAEIKKIKDGVQTSFELNDLEKTNNINDITENLFSLEKVEFDDSQKEVENVNLTMPSPEVNASDSLEIPLSIPISINEDLDKPVEENKINIENKTPFIPAFDRDVKPIIIDEDEFLDKKQDNNEFINKFKYQDAIEEVKNILPSIKNKGVKIDIEEHDLEGKYQIVINIDKDSLN